MKSERECGSLKACSEALRKLIRSKKLLLFAGFWNCFCYFGSKLFADGSRAVYAGTAFDDKIPVLPWMITIYLGSYVFWFFLYDDRLRTAGEETDRFFYADLIGKAVCAGIFILVPTTMLRPAVTGQGLWYRALRILYELDSPVNLFPSIHCFNSWLCWIGIRGRIDRGMTIKSLTLASAIAICVSTLTVRQHVIADAAGGILLAELCYQVTGIFLKKS